MIFSIKPSLVLWILVIFCVLIMVMDVCGQQSSKKRRKQKTQQLCNETKFEADFDRLLVVTSKDRSFPENQQQLKQFCTENNELSTELNRYKNQCLRETLKNFISIIIYSLKASMKRICARPNSTQVVALINASSCINRNKKPINKCMDKGSDSFAAIKLVNNDLKLPYICCEFVQILRCVADVMNQNGCQDKLPVLLENIQGVTGNYMDATCGEYNADSDKCEQMAPLNRDVRASTKNFVTNLVEIFNSV